MIYLDNSATTFPKPSVVTNSIKTSFEYSANPGRSGHELSIKAAQVIYDARKSIADFFCAENDTNVIFTLNCTSALNIVMKGILKSGDHVVVSNLEHNAVMRPLEKLHEKGITYSIAETVMEDDNKTVASFRREINSKTRMMICTNASNVWGMRLPIERLCFLAHEYGLIFVVDAAQSAGIIPINMKEDKYDFICTAGHKGLYGPMGTGLMVMSGKIHPDTLIEGGTGSNSILLTQPDELPDKYESGTQNLLGIVGLNAGINFVKKKSISKISHHEFSLIQQLYKSLEKMQNIYLYTPIPTPEYFVPILSFNIKNIDSEEVASLLSKKGFAVRAGLHCCPSAHKAFGTIKTGTVRISPSIFTTHNDIEKLVYTIKKIS